MVEKKWPKKIPDFTPEQKRMRDEFMLKWHQELPSKFGAMEVFNHGYPEKMFRRHDKARKPFWRTMEIGGGTGSHIPYEDMSAQDYSVMDLRQNMLDELKRKHPEINCVQGDCQLPYSAGMTYDRFVAIHVLEHLPNLPEALRQVYQRLSPDGVFHVVIPCEGSLAYTICRKISAERLWHKLYHCDYTWCIKSEHVNLAKEVMEEVSKYFDVKYKRYFPIPLPFEFCNIAVGMTLYPKKGVVF